MPPPSCISDPLPSRGSIPPPGMHGTYPGIADFTGFLVGEHTLAEVRPLVKREIQIKDMRKEPMYTEARLNYEPLRKAFEEKHRDKCNVLFKLKVRHRWRGEKAPLFSAAGGITTWRPSCR